jgi:hypothetical protein
VSVGLLAASCGSSGSETAEPPPGGGDQGGSANGGAGGQGASAGTGTGGAAADASVSDGAGGTAGGASGAAGNGGSGATAGAAGNAGSGAAAGAAGSSGASGAAGDAGACSPPCTGTKFCSAAGYCIETGTCVLPADCPPNKSCDPVKHLCIDQCVAMPATQTPIAPNLLVVLDRSCSMTAKVGTLTKWQISVAALKTLTTNFNAKIRFGLTLFPDIVTPDCAQGAIPIPVGPGKEAQIQTLLTSSLVKTDPYYPDGPCVTNIDTAMQQAATEPAFNDKTRDSYALLLTDGKQAGCNLAGGDTGTTTIITNLYQNKKVPTFVVGFGSEVDPAQLNIFAQAGGVPTGNPTTKFYKAEDQTSLDAALATIASKTMSCSFKLNQTPPDPTKIYVYFDKVKSVPRDPNHQNGWDYDPNTNTVTFYGQACTDIKNGTVKKIDVIFNCPEPPP